MGSAEACPGAYPSWLAARCADPAGRLWRISAAPPLQPGLVIALTFLMVTYPGCLPAAVPDPAGPR